MEVEYLTCYIDYRIKSSLIPVYTYSCLLQSILGKNRLYHKINKNNSVVHTLL